MTRYQDLRVLFGWLVDEEEIASSPMARMKPPILPEVPVPVLTPDEQRALLAACDGKEFDARRNTAWDRVEPQEAGTVVTLSAIRRPSFGSSPSRSPGAVSRSTVWAWMVTPAWRTSWVTSAA